MRFSPARLQTYANDLSQAVHALSLEQHMSVRELKDALRAIPGIADLTVSYAPNGNQIISLAGRTTEVSPMASNEEIAQALANPFIKSETRQMSITGLQSGAFQAKLAEMRQKIADSQAKGLAKIDAAVTQGAADLDAAAESAAAKAKSEIADALQEFGLTTNGGPA